MAVPCRSLSRLLRHFVFHRAIDIIIRNYPDNYAFLAVRHAVCQSSAISFLTALLIIPVRYTDYMGLLQHLSKKLTYLLYPLSDHSHPHTDVPETVPLVLVARKLFCR